MRGRIGKALAHYSQLADEARVRRYYGEARVRPFGDSQADDLLHNHGIALREDVEYDGVELEARQRTASQLREIADRLDPPRATDEADGARVVVSVFRHDPHGGPSCELARREIDVPCVGDGLFNAPVLGGGRSVSLTLSVHRIS